MFRPPNVSGWDETRWLDTSSFRGRWIAGLTSASDELASTDGEYSEDETPAEAVNKALRFWAEPGITPGTQAELLSSPRRPRTPIEGDWQESAYRGLRQNALRMLIANSPDMQAS